MSQSNAGYYMAGASLVGAAAIAFFVLKKKDDKAVDDEFRHM